LLLLLLVLLLLLIFEETAIDGPGMVGADVPLRASAIVVVDLPLFLSREKRELSIPLLMPDIWNKLYH
jgi:hypothetical protein